MHKTIAKIQSTMLGFEDHGLLTAVLHVAYGRADRGGHGGEQGLGCMMLGGLYTDGFIRGVLKACGVDTWERLKGRTIMVVLEDEGFNARPLGIEPLATEPGEPFMFDEALNHAEASEEHKKLVKQAAEKLRP